MIRCVVYLLQIFKMFLSLSISVRITMIRCVVYLLQIFKMFHGLMNNPVQHDIHVTNINAVKSDQLRTVRHYQH
jgi:hypothetical protein